MDGGTVTEADAALVEKNLAITGISLPDTDLDIGDAVRPDVRIANTGTEDAALAFGAGVWLSVDPVFDLEEDRLLSYFVYDPESIPLPAGAERDLFLYFAWTAEIAAEFASGPYHLIGAISYFEGTGDDRPDDDFFSVQVAVEGTGTPLPNAPPEAVDDTAETTQEDAVDIAVLANDSDPDGDTLTILGATQPANGSVSVVDGSIRFVPDAGFTGTTSFTYTIEDSAGATDTATVAVAVLPAEPQAKPDLLLVPGTMGIHVYDAVPDNRFAWDEDTRLGLFVRGTLSGSELDPDQEITLAWYLSPVENLGIVTRDDVRLTSGTLTVRDLLGADPVESMFILGVTDFAALSIEPGTYFLGAIIDPDDVIGEADEANNALVLEFATGSSQYVPIEIAEVERVQGTDGDDVLVGGSGPEVFLPGPGDDSVSGGGGNDRFIGGPGADRMDGGDGYDTVDYREAEAAIGAFLELPLKADALSDASGDEHAGIERILGSRFDDEIVGDAGDTDFVGGPGADTIDGGAGVDLASYADSDAPVSVDLAAAVQSGGTAEGDRLTGIENVTGSVFDDTLAGDAGDNRLDGGLGSDAIDGRGGRDTAPYQLLRDGVTETVEPDGSVRVATVTGETDRLVSVERIELLDGTYLYDLAGADLPFVYRVYDAAFARTPDEAGLRFWAEKVGSGALDLGALARAFVESPEFDTLFPSATDGEFIEALYANALRREPDDAGRTFWLDAFATGTLTRTDMLELFADSPENLIRNEDNYDDGVWVI